MEKFKLVGNIAVCRKCGKVCDNKIKLGDHYRENPTHKLKPGEVTPEAQKVIEELIAERQKSTSPSTDLVVVDKSQQTQGQGRRRKEKPVDHHEVQQMIRFCPCCGMDLEKLAIAINLVREMGDGR